MALQIADRVKETSIIVGTGTATLLGAEVGYQPLSVIADGETAPYVIETVDANGVPTGQWETGVGTVGAGGTTVARTTPKDGSSGPLTLVNFAAGTKFVFVDRISALSMEMNTANTQVLFNNAGVFGGFGSWDGTTLGLGVGKRLAFAGALGAFDLRASDDAVPYLEIGGTFPLVRASISAENGVPVVIHNSDFTLVNAGNGNYINFFQSNGTIASPTILTVGEGVGTFNFGAWYPAGGYYDFFAGIAGRIDADYSAYPGAAVAIELQAAVDATGDYGACLTAGTNGNVKIGRSGTPRLVGLRGTATNELSVVQPESTTLATLKAAGVTLTPAVGASALTVAGVAQTASFPVLDLAQTWNNAGVAFVGVGIDITSTASNILSTPFRVRVGGTTIFDVRRDGYIHFNGWEGISGTVLNVYLAGGTLSNQMVAAGIFLNATAQLVGEASGVLALRNSTAAQKFRLYNTSTTVNTAGEWFAIDWQTTANVCNLQAVKGSSTGTARVLNISYGGAEASPVAAISIPITSGDITFGGSVFPTGYKSSDGSAGATGGPWTSVTVKNGLVVSGS